MRLPGVRTASGWAMREDAEGRLHFFGDSEGRIVRGLLAVL